MASASPVSYLIPIKSTAKSSTRRQSRSSSIVVDVAGLFEQSLVKRVIRFLSFVTLTLFPLVAICFLSAISMHHSYAATKEAVNFQERLSEAQLVRQLVHHLQRERGITCICISVSM